jgi:hypothetical protein
VGKFEFAKISTPVHLPVSVGLKAELQKPVLGIVTLAAFWTLQIAAPGRALPIVVFRNREGCPATAGHDVKLQVIGDRDVH